MINQKINHILLLSSYPPRECGIATYSNDLVNILTSKFGSSFVIDVCALEESKETRRYPPEVRYTLDTSSPAAYHEMAQRINAAPDIKDIFIQHEFGLFGGEYGEYIIPFLNELKKPVIVCFHTVLPSPDTKRKQIVTEIAATAVNIIVMTENSKKLLATDYGVEPNKISVIPHGTHLVSFNETEELKAKHDLTGKFVLSTFGLLGPNKSIETAIEALPAIVAEFPDAIYLILGKTHPGVVKHEGESYRRELEKRVTELNLSEHVRFVNKYLELSEILEYLRLTDIYLFTSRDPYQAVSGTFAYALSCGCPIISTPIPHATELLRDGTGLFFDFQDSAQLADRAIGLIADNDRRREMKLNALHKTNPMVWENVAITHAQILNKYTGKDLSYDLPPISLRHIQKLTDEFGMIQFAPLSIPDISSGYTLDDNARALIAVLKHYELSRSDEAMGLIEKYLLFIEHCQQPDGKFLNYVSEDKSFHEYHNNIHLDDSNARAIWALGTLISLSDIMPQGFVDRAKAMFDRSLGWIRELHFLRAASLSIKGLYLYNTIFKDSQIQGIVKTLANRLLTQYDQTADSDWLWFEEHLSYGNNLMPEGLLYAYLTTGGERCRVVAKESFDFLLSHIFNGNVLQVISNKGWFARGAEKHEYGEQPIEASYIIQALQLFYDTFGDEGYREQIGIAFSWFLGNNRLERIVYNPLSGGCYDGLERDSVNLNQGAESTVCYLIARLVMEKNKRKTIEVLYDADQSLETSVH